MYAYIDTCHLAPRSFVGLEMHVTLRSLASMCKIRQIGYVVSYRPDVGRRQLEDCAAGRA